MPDKENLDVPHEDLRNDATEDNGSNIDLSDLDTKENN